MYYITSPIPPYVILLLLLYFQAALAVPAELSNNVASPCSGHRDFDCGVGEPEATRCISGLWQCDNVYDCKSGLDEQKCHYLHKCPTGDFMCLNGDCIPADFKCNAHFDCLDGSDERSCSLPQLQLPRPIISSEEKNAINPEAINQDLFSLPSEFSTSIDKAEDLYADELETKTCECGSGSNIVSTFFLVFLLLGIILPTAYYVMRFRTPGISRVDSALKELNTRIVTTSRTSSSSTLSPARQNPFLDDPTNSLQQPTTPITINKM